MNVASNPTFAALNQRGWKEGMIDLFRDQRFTHALTVSWNRDTPLPVATRHLKALHALVDRRLLGPRYARKPRDQRTPAVFVYEGLSQGGFVHAHSLWRVRDRRHLLPFARLFPGERGGVWNQIVEGGSYKLDLNDDPRVFAGYALKGQHPGSAEDQIVWSTDFLPGT